MLEFTRLEDAKEHCLDGRIELTDLVEKECSIVRELKTSFLLCHGSRERPSLMAEQFAFRQVFRERSRVHGHKRTVGIRTVGMNRPRHQLFACSALALNEHG